jgi:hypothetical protein
MIGSSKDVKVKEREAKMYFLCLIDCNSAAPEISAGVRGVVVAENNRPRWRIYSHDGTLIQRINEGIIE